MNEHLVNIAKNEVTNENFQDETNQTVLWLNIVNN